MPIIVFLIFLIATLPTQMAFAAVTEGCGLFDVNLECDLSGWMKLFLGDIAIAATLAIFLHFLAHRTQSKLEMIIETEENLRNRRKDYAVMQLKSLFNSILYTLGSVNKQIIHFNTEYRTQTNEDKKIWLRGILLSEIRAEEAKMGRILLSARNTLIASNDVLNPEINQQISGIITFLVEISKDEHEDGTLDFPKYDICKSKIKFLTEIFSSYSFGTHSFANIEKHSQESANSSQSTRTKLTLGELEHD
jgi:hypothetical protein